MSHLSYLAVLFGCLAAAIWLEPVLRVGVLARRRRLMMTLLLVGAGFIGWDVAAVAAGHWWYDERHLLGITMPGRLPVEEVLFFFIVPLCAVLGFEAVGKVLSGRVREPGNRR